MSRPDAASRSNWELAIIAATVLSVAGVSRRLTGMPVTPAVVFVLVGVLVGPLVIDDVAVAPTGAASTRSPRRRSPSFCLRTPRGSSLAC
jgi:hypothetical protein